MFFSKSKNHSLHSFIRRDNARCEWRKKKQKNEWFFFFNELRFIPQLARWHMNETNSARPEGSRECVCLLHINEFYWIWVRRAETVVCFFSFLRCLVVVGSAKFENEIIQKGIKKKSSADCSNTSTIQFKTSSIISNTGKYCRSCFFRLCRSASVFEWLLKMKWKREK